MNNNDDKILELKRKIELEKAKLKEVSHFTPQTTCVYKINNDVKFNIRTMSINELNQMLIIVQTLICTAVPMNLIDTKFSGFTLAEWKADIIGIRDQKKIVERKAAIAQYESKLQSMLSDDKKTELEIAAIENALAIGG